MSAYGMGGREQMVSLGGQRGFRRTATEFLKIDDGHARDRIDCWITLAELGAKFVNKARWQL
jgi:hypothetical protein